MFKGIRGIYSIRHADAANGAAEPVHMNIWRTRPADSDGNSFLNITHAGNEFETLIKYLGRKFHPQDIIKKC